MKNLRQLHLMQYLCVVIGVLAIAFLKLNVSFFAQGLTGTLLLALVVCAALLGDYVAGLLAIVLGLLAQNYLHAPAGFNLERMAMFQSIEFLIASALLCTLAWRERTARKDKDLLLVNIEELRGIISSLQKDAKGRSKEAKHLKQLNKELDGLVKQFVEDEEYWKTRWGVSKTTKLF